MSKQQFFRIDSIDVRDRDPTGNPEEIVEKIKTVIEPSGVNHVILGLIDGHLAKTLTGRDVDVPDIKAQLQLVHDEVMPALS